MKNNNEVRKERFVDNIVNEGKGLLTYYLQEGFIDHPRLGVCYGKRTWKQVCEFLEDIVDLARERNLTVFKREDGSRCLYFEYAGIE